MIEGILTYIDGAWCIVDENNKRESIEATKTTELDVDGKWVECHVIINKDRILIDREAELNPFIANEMKIRIRQY